ncbi:MAG: carbon storage regulator CsrA [Planctomycetota bacterium]|nr:carbon storage regulator CsrA [Planctomycetota bacterium]
MLVLSRQRDETIMIGDEIEITVVDIRGDKVRLGITAPTSIAVHRKEVYEAIRSENKNAAKLNGDLQMISQTIPPGRERAAARSKAAQLARPVRPDSQTEPIVKTAKPAAKRTG